MISDHDEISSLDRSPVKAGQRLLSRLLTPVMAFVATVDGCCRGMTTHKAFGALVCIGIAGYFSYFLYRRSQGLEAAFGTGRFGPDEFAGEYDLEDRLCLLMGLIFPIFYLWILNDWPPPYLLLERF